ncbi:MAG: hypothetical protein JXB36_09280 [Gammaproteobacteria bacterium]|nr:hypothetical protein [Gammaproteobacteria bacterium]
MKTKLQILLVALVCVGPVIGAYLLYYGGDLDELPILANPERRLLESPVELPSLPGRVEGAVVDDLLSGPTWSLVYARTSPCGERCLGDLVRLRQVELALGRDLDRVQRIFIGPGDDSKAGRDPTIVTASFDGPAGAELLAVLERVGHAPGADGRVYVVDPHGNLVMSYPPDPDQEGLLDDLERLLSVSRIG